MVSVLGFVWFAFAETSVAGGVGAGDVRRACRKDSTTPLWWVEVEILGSWRCGCGCGCGCGCPVLAGGAAWDADAVPPFQWRPCSGR